MNLKTIAALAGKFFSWLEKLLKSAFKSYGQADIRFDFGQAFVWILLFLLIFGSGCVAYSIARARQRKAWFFFLLGCILPVLAPLVMSFLLDTADEKREKKSRREQLPPNISGGIATAEQAAEQKDAGSENGSTWNREYFAGIYRRADGSVAGPWNITYGGSTVIVREILEIQDELMVVIMVNQKGQDIKMRIPFAKVQNCVERTEPLPEKNETAEQA